MKERQQKISQIKYYKTIITKKKGGIIGKLTLKRRKIFAQEDTEEIPLEKVEELYDKSTNEWRNFKQEIKKNEERLIELYHRK